MAYQFALMSMQFAFPYDPLDWGSTLDVGSQEPDDWLHNPDPRRDRQVDNDINIFTSRGLTNLGCLVILVIAMVGLLCVQSSSFWPYVLY